MGRILNDEQLAEAVLSVTRNQVLDKTGWQAIAEGQDISTLKAVGQWLTNITISDNTIANEIIIVEGIGNLLQGRMPKEIE